MKFINPSTAPRPVGPYSTAVLAGNGMLFLSGQLGLDPVTGALDGATVADQARRALSNIQAVLADAGYALTDIVRCVIYLTDLGKFQEMNEVYASFFGDHKPARTTVGVASLPKGGLVEIEVTAAGK